MPLKIRKGAEKATLSNAITNADSSNIDNIINILLSVNAFEYSRKVAKNESTKALKFLEVIPNSEYRSALQLLCELSLDRNS